MTRRRGFTLIELLVVISIIALLIGILLPALGAARRSARQAQSNTQVRGIHQSMVMFSQGNKNFYPGIRSNGTEAVPDDVQTSNSGTGKTVEGRYAIMLLADYFNGEYAISPVEADKTVWTTGQVKQENYSFAMLRIGGGASEVFASGGADGNLRLVREEWRQTLNQQAIALSDRLTNQTGGVTASNLASHMSIHTDKEGDWKGSVAWNDNHVRFETSSNLVTKYTPNGIINDEGNTTTSSDGDGLDNIFDNDTNAPMTDARMVAESWNGTFHTTP